MRTSRVILYKGIDVTSKEWVEGFYLEGYNTFNRSCREYYIFDATVNSKYNVIPESVGQYTGKRDINDVGIFEGDIVRTHVPIVLNTTDKYVTGVVKFGEYTTAYSSNNLGFYIDWELNQNLALYCEINDIEVIGNIYDKPELLKGGTE